MASAEEEKKEEIKTTEVEEIKVEDIIANYDVPLVEGMLRSIYQMDFKNYFDEGIIKRTEFYLICDNDEVCVAVSYNTLTSLLDIQVDDGKF